MGRAWADKEHAAESQYFNKRDAELLAKLADKLHATTAVCLRIFTDQFHCYLLLVCLGGIKRLNILTVFAYVP